jgi:WD40 repeat protein
VALRDDEFFFYELAFTAKGQGVIALSPSGLARSWEVATGAEQKSVHLKDAPLSHTIDPPPFQLSPDGRWVLTPDPEENNNPNIVKFAVWDTTTGKVRYRHQLPAELWAGGDPCAWSADGTMAVLEGRGGLTVISIESGQVLSRLSGGATHYTERVAISSDGRLVAAWKDPDGENARLAVWEVATGKEVANVPAGSARHLAFGRGGRVLVADDDVKGLRVWDLATGHERSSSWNSQAGELLTTSDGKRAVAVQPDGTALVWDLTATASPPEKWTRKQLAGWWVNLGSTNAGRAYQAVWRLADVPSDELVPFLRNALKPTTPDTATVRRLVADLDSADFAVRETASRDLTRLGPDAIPAIRKALKESRSAEARQRLTAVLKRLGDPRLRLARAVAVLEQVGSSDARKLLTELAGGSAEAPATQEAKAALRRLSR